MTGLLRKQIIPFLWSALLALRPASAQDAGEVVQSASFLNELQIQLLDVTIHESRNTRSETEIESIQSLAHCNCWSISTYLDSSISTKQKPLMYHVHDHLIDHGFG